MTRKIKKLVIYLSTADGTIHLTRAEAQEHVDSIPEPKRARKHTGPTLVHQVLNAIAKGKNTALDIRNTTSVPPRLVHPTLSNLRKRGLVKGKAGNMKLTRAGERRLKGSK